MSFGRKCGLQRLSQAALGIAKTFQVKVNVDYARAWRLAESVLPNLDFLSGFDKLDFSSYFNLHPIKSPPPATPREKTHKMKYRQEAIGTAEEASGKAQDTAILDSKEDAQAEDLYATTYTAEEDNTLHYGRIFLTELRITPPVAVNLSQPPQQYADLLRFPVDQAVRLFDDADGNARWISEDALYMHERVIQQDRVRLHPAADPIGTILQRAEAARDAGAEPHLEGLPSYLRDAPAITRPTIEDLLAEILEDPAGHGMFEILDQGIPGPRAAHPPVATQFQAAYANTTPSSDSYSIADAVREGRRTNQRFDQQRVPSAAGLATPKVPQQTSASRPSLPPLPVNATPLRQVSNVNDFGTTTVGQPSIRGVERVRNGNVRKPDTAQDAQRQHNGGGSSANDRRMNEHLQAPRQMSRLNDVTDPDYEAIIYDSEPEL